jgi:hypothetical protein
MKKDKYKDFKVGRFYKTCHGYVFHVRTNEDGEKYIVQVYGGADEEYVYSIKPGDTYNDTPTSPWWLGECDSQGNLVSPAPKVGQVWKDNYRGNHYRINEGYRPSGERCYMTVGLLTTWYVGSTPEEAVSGLEYHSG